MVVYIKHGYQHRIQSEAAHDEEHKQGKGSPEERREERSRREHKEEEGSQECEDVQIKPECREGPSGLLCERGFE